MQAPDMKNHLIAKNYNTQDIIDAIIDEDEHPGHRAHTTDLAQTLQRGTAYETCKAVYDFIISTQKYKEDDDGQQLIKTPSRTHKDGFADCKSLTLFVTSILQNLNIQYVICFVGHDTYSHVFPIALTKDRAIILDTVLQLQNNHFLNTGSRFDQLPPHNLFKAYGTPKALQLFKHLQAV